MAMKMSLAMPLHDIMAYRKIARAYFSLLDVLCHNHVPALAEGDGRTFAFVVSSLEAGLRSLEVVVSSQCASAVDNLAGYYFKHVVAAEETPSPTAQVQSHLRPIARLWHICTRCRRMSQRLRAQQLPIRLDTCWTKALFRSLLLGCMGVALYQTLSSHPRNIGWKSIRPDDSDMRPSWLYVMPGCCAQAMNRHLQQHPQLFGSILSTLLEVVLFEDCANQWSLSRPMLSVVLINEHIFEELKARIVAMQPLDRRQQLVTCLNGLMRDVGRNLEPKNRDKFTQVGLLIAVFSSLQLYNDL